MGEQVERRARVVVPAEREGKVLVVRVRLGDDVEGRFVVDTGAGASGLSRACARRFDGSLMTNMHVRTPTGLTAVGSLYVPYLQVGPLKVTDQRLAVVPLANDRVDGLLGLDFFRAVGATSVAVNLREPSLEVRFDDAAD